MATFHGLSEALVVLFGPDGGRLTDTMVPERAAQIFVESGLSMHTITQERWRAAVQVQAYHLWEHLRRGDPQLDWTDAEHTLGSYIEMLRSQLCWIGRLARPQTVCRQPKKKPVTPHPNRPLPKQHAGFTVSNH